MSKKRTVDMIICSIAAAIIILSDTYIEQQIYKNTVYVLCGFICFIFFMAAIMDFWKNEKKRKGRNTASIQELILLDEEGNEISAWHIGGKTAVLIGRDTCKENVDINLHNTEYGGMVDRQHAVLNYAGEQWYIEDLSSKNGIKICHGEDGELYQVSKEHLCKINSGDMIYIAKTRLKAK